MRHGHQLCQLLSDTDVLTTLFPAMCDCSHWHLWQYLILSLLMNVYHWHLLAMLLAFFWLPSDKLQIFMTLISKLILYHFPLYYESRICHFMASSVANQGHWGLPSPTRQRLLFPIHHAFFFLIQYSRQLLLFTRPHSTHT